MNDLIRIENREGKETVNARELHGFIESKRDFSDWIKYRINQYGFEYGKDFTTILGESSGGRKGIEYHISIDMAKELSMVENNVKGREARQYFIEVEKRVKSLSYQSEDQILQNAFFILDSRVKKLEEEKKQLTVKADVADRLANTDGLILLSDAGKQICGHPLNFIQWAEDSGIIFRRKLGGVLLPKAIYQMRDYFKLKSRSVNGHLREQLYLTPKGLTWICAKYNKAHGLLNFQTEGIA